MNEITCSELRTRLERHDEIFILDVRQPEEFAGGHIAGSKLIPLGELPSRIQELDKNADIIIACHSGGRSARACEYLANQGFKKVTNLLGGNARWQAEGGHAMTLKSPGVPKG
jgi:rhodanese-related sulfurtransferase